MYIEVRVEVGGYQRVNILSVLLTSAVEATVLQQSDIVLCEFSDH